MRWDSELRKGDRLATSADVLSPRGDNSPLSRRPPSVVVCSGRFDGRPGRVLSMCDRRASAVGARGGGSARLLQCGICGWKKPDDAPGGRCAPAVPPPPKFGRARCACCPPGDAICGRMKPLLRPPNVFAARCNGGGEASRPPLPPGGMSVDGPSRGRERDGVICCCGALVERRSPPSASGGVWAPPVLARSWLYWCSHAAAFRCAPGPGQGGGRGRGGGGESAREARSAQSRAAREGFGGSGGGSRRTAFSL